MQNTIRNKARWILPPASPKEYEDRDCHLKLRKLTLSSAKNCDLFATLFYFYFYCISQCSNYYYYMWRIGDISRAEIDINEEICFMEEMASSEFENESFDYWLDLLKISAIAYYNIAPEKQQRKVQSLLKKIGWKLDDVFEKYNCIACEAIIKWQEKSQKYLSKIIDASASHIFDYDYGNKILNANISRSSFEPYKVNRIAYWYIVFSMKWDLLDKSLLTEKTGKELYDFLAGIENNLDLFDETKRKSVLYIADMALEGMRPFVESRNWLKMTETKQQ